jgi:YggT family protein
MIMEVVGMILYRFVQLFALVVILDVLLSYFMNPYHPVKAKLDRVVEPFLAPIRRVIPPMGGLDFSPIVLIVALQILGRIILALTQT